MLSSYKEVHGLCRTINPLLQVGELFRCHLWSIVHLSSSNCRRGALFFYITQWLNLKTIQTYFIRILQLLSGYFFAFVFPNFSIFCLPADEFDIIVVLWFLMVLVKNKAFNVFKGQLISKWFFWGHRFPPKNERTNSTLLL